MRARQRSTTSSAEIFRWRTASAISTAEEKADKVTVGSGLALVRKEMRKRPARCSTARVASSGSRHSNDGDFALLTRRRLLDDADLEFHLSAPSGNANDGDFCLFTRRRLLDDTDLKLHLLPPVQVKPTIAILF